MAGVAPPEEEIGDVPDTEVTPVAGSAEEVQLVPLPMIA